MIVRVQLYKQIEEDGTVVHLTEEELHQRLEAAIAGRTLITASTVTVAETFQLGAFYGGGKSVAHVPIMVLFLQ